MFKDFEQFVPSQKCLSCHGCCRFAEKQSCWNVKISQREKEQVEQGKEKGKIFINGVVTDEGFIHTIPHDGRFVCHFFNPNSNACGIYPRRPFECQLYPFLLSQKQGQPFIAVHLSCPYVQTHKTFPSYQDYVEQLKAFFIRHKDSFQDADEMFRDYASFDQEIEYLFSLRELYA